MPVATSLFPRLLVTDADAAIAFYAEVFGVSVQKCHRTPDGAVVHAALAVGGVEFHLKEADEHDPDAHAVGGTPVILSVYTDDVDEMYRAALERGAEVIYPLETWFYGDRGARIRDPFGLVWMLSTKVEDVSDEEMARRMAEWSEGQG